MSAIKLINTLRFSEEHCCNCGMCWTVCPHEVFQPGEKYAALVNWEACMECGACRMNCPTGAIEVESGVGCAAAMFLSALLGREEVTCGDSDDSTCCG